MSATRRANNEGSKARLRADGRWHVMVYGNTLEDVNQKRLEFLLDHHYKGLPVSDGRVSVAGYLRDWLDGRKSEIRPSTYACYRTTIERHLIPELGTVRLARLAARDVKRALDALEEKKLSPRTRQLARSVLRSAVKQAVQWEELPRNVVDLVKAPRVEREEVRPLSVAQVETFLAGVAGDRLEALYVLAFTLGLRQGELLGLRWKDVDFAAGEIHIVQARLRGGRLKAPETLFGAPKSKRSRRSLPMPTMTAQALWRREALWREERKVADTDWEDFGLVFSTAMGTPLDGVNVGRYFKRHLTRLGLPIVRFHDCRHTAASLLLAKGVSLRVISEVLGHSQISLTADTYAHVLPALKQEAAAAMDSLFGRAQEANG
jgi:integrase